MAHRVAPQAEAELDGIWRYIAEESGSFEITDRVIDSLTRGFSFLPNTPTSDGAVMRICVRA
jgi:hypothetical protein